MNKLDVFDVLTVDEFDYNWLKFGLSGRVGGFKRKRWNFGH